MEPNLSATDRVAAPQTIPAKTSQIARMRIVGNETKLLIVRQEPPKKRSTFVDLSAASKTAAEIRSVWWKVIRVGEGVTIAKVGDCIIAKEMIGVEFDEDGVAAIAFEDKVFLVLEGGQ